MGPGDSVDGDSGRVAVVGRTNSGGPRTPGMEGMSMSVAVVKVQISSANSGQSNIKETFTSIIIAFTLAFVFRGFVIEAFLIPTGSMAPTLRGQHIALNSPQSGYDWAGGPREYIRGTQNPAPVQQNVSATDPMTGMTIGPRNMPNQMGDRIFVLKYLDGVYEPQRFDVVVFKNPIDPTINYIKRLVGLPNEEIALIDGDVWTRQPQPSDADLLAKGENLWRLPGWTIARKPLRAQEAMWQPVFNSAYAPIDSTKDGRTIFEQRWRGIGNGPSGSDWKVGGREYTFTGTGKGDGKTVLEWNAERFPISDFYSYNDMPNIRAEYFPVSDVRMSAGIRPTVEGQKMSCVVYARQSEFRADLDPKAGTAVLRMRPRPADDRGVPNAPPAEDWKIVAEGKLPAGTLAVGRVTNVSFAHVDQSMELLIDDASIAKGVYDWSPLERVTRSIKTPEAIEGQRDALDVIKASNNLLTVRQNYRPVRAQFEFEGPAGGGAFTLYRVGMERDIWYQPGIYQSGPSAGLPAAATHPREPHVLNDKQIFVCGDNSPASLDARYWDHPDPWVAQIDPTVGVVNTELLIGKAFVVYFPAPKRRGNIPVPSFGDMRWIW